MKTLIIYYTRTGTTKKLSEALGKKLGADIESLIDPVDYSGALGYMKAGRAAMKKAPIDLSELKYDPIGYDLVLIGTPVWVGVCAPAVRTFVEKYQDKCTRIALFATQGSDKEQRVFSDLKSLLKKEPVAAEFFTTKEVGQDIFEDKMDKFIGKLK